MTSDQSKLDEYLSSLKDPEKELFCFLKDAIFNFGIVAVLGFTIDALKTNIRIMRDENNKPAFDPVTVNTYELQVIASKVLRDSLADIEREATTRGLNNDLW